MSDNPLHEVRVRNLMPGVWEDALGAVHVSIPEALTHLRLPHTRENHNLVLEVVRELSV